LSLCFFYSYIYYKKQSKNQLEFSKDFFIIGISKNIKSQGCGIFSILEYDKNYQYSIYISKKGGF